jgi:hypothetical protein
VWFELLNWWTRPSAHFKAAVNRAQFRRFAKIWGLQTARSVWTAVTLASLWFAAAIRLKFEFRSQLALRQV